jgi:hypothetical protein
VRRLSISITPRRSASTAQMMITGSRIATRPPGTAIRCSRISRTNSAVTQLTVRCALRSGTSQSAAWAWTATVIAGATRPGSR